MDPSVSSNELRLIGQDLESLDLRDFKVEKKEGVYHVSGKAMMTRAVQAAPEGTLARLWHNLTKGGVMTDQPRLVDVERRYTAEDLEEVRRQVIDRRQEAPQKAAPESYSPSQMLRVIGAFIDGKQGEFLSFARQGRLVQIEYRTPAGEVRKDEQPFSQLLDFSHYMYRQREREE